MSKKLQQMTDSCHHITTKLSSPFIEHLALIWVETFLPTVCVICDPKIVKFS
jgi:hypothetical protein